MFAVDVPSVNAPLVNSMYKLYKSNNSGVTWDNLLKDPVKDSPLFIAGAKFPIWDIAVAPDDSNFVVVITDGSGVPPPPPPPSSLPSGPKNVFISADGGQNWENANLAGLGPNDFISCLAISPLYDIDKRYIAIGTREGTSPLGGNGKVFTFKAPGPSAWVNQTILPSTGWVSGDVVALKFSPSYTIDYTIIAVFASSSPAPAGGLFLTTGTHDVISNRTQWKIGPGYPVKITTSDGKSPDHNQIITADLELPADFFGSDPGTLRRSFVSFDALTMPVAGTYFSGVYRVDDVNVFQLMYNSSLPASPSRRISSIAYYGTFAIGKLIAGETTTNLTRGKVDIWLCSDPFTVSPPPAWTISDVIKSPTGGGNSAFAYGFANAFLMWSADGVRVYCGTSSANLINGGTSWAVGSWPNGLLTGFQRNDESAFSISRDNGVSWNQLSLIDTEITRLSDVAVIEAPENSLDYGVLYLASINSPPLPPQPNNFDSIWRSIRDPLGQRWERIWCGLAANNDLIVRINPRVTEIALQAALPDQARSRAIVIADRTTANIWYSLDEGQNWQVPYPNFPITDLSLSSDTSLFILSDTYVVRGSYDMATWKWGAKINTGLSSGHTITTPLKNPNGKNNLEDWVLVGSAFIGEVSWADFSQVPVKFSPSPEQIVRTPVQGDVHIIADEQFDANKIIYAAVKGGKIYRWVIGSSSAWDDLQPPDNDFYGVEQKKGALYGSYNTPILPNTKPGVDRALYPREPIPPVPEWDPLAVGISSPPVFTREPTSLKASSNADNDLWAIDNQTFDWAAKKGCLWIFTDTLAKHGPWTTAPASNDVIPADPVTGRANEVNFLWRQLSYTTGYELQISKDEKFILQVLDKANIVPSNSVAPGWILFPGLLEASHKYYWRVRVSSSYTGESIRSPWSATMYFTVMAGFPVTARHLGPTLLQPPNQCTSCGPSPSFSWSPMFMTTSYEFILARDPALTQVIEKVTVPTPAYQYQDKLEKGTYYWRVNALKPMISEPSPVGNFTVTDTTNPLALLFPEISESTSMLVWIGIGIYTAFALSMLALIMKTRYSNRKERETED